MHQPNHEQSIGILASIQVGKPTTHTDSVGEWTTGFFKEPIQGPAEVGSLGIDGDGQADLKHHGGVDKALLAYSANHYPCWKEELEFDFPYGAFAENLSIENLSEQNVCIGDHWKIGKTVLEVSQPRKPCWKLSRRWGNNSLPKHVVRTGRSGWYLRVLDGGTIEQGDKVILQSRPQPNWTIARANGVMYGTDRKEREELSQVPELAADWQHELAS